MQTELPKRADVVVIGGGIVGASIAWQLASRGAGRIVLLEREIVAAGSSGRTGALLRQHYTNVPEATLAARSLEVFASWDEIVGGFCGFDPCGLIVTVPTNDEFSSNVDRMRSTVAQLNRIGVAIDLVDRTQLRDLDPTACFDDITHATFEAKSGYVDAIATTTTMAAAAERAGAIVRQGIGVTGLRTSTGNMNAVETTAGVIETPQVVLAAGAWSVPIAQSIGIDLPIDALRVQIGVFQHGLASPPSPRAYVDNAAGIFCRPWGADRTMIGLGGGDQHDPVDPDRFESRNDLTYPTAALAAARKRFPAVGSARFLHGHAGLYDMSPDGHPLIGAIGPDGLWVAAGFSGAGFKKGPAIGIAAADQLLTGRCDWVDLDRFSPERFSGNNWRDPWSVNEYALGSDFGHGL